VVDGLGIHAAGVADIGAAVTAGVAIEDFAIRAFSRDTNAIAPAHYRGGVHDHDEQVIRGFAVADELQNTVVGVVGIKPLEALPIEIDFVQGGFRGVETIEVADELLNAAMRRVFE
jgi:hypothetical protein